MRHAEIKARFDEIVDFSGVEKFLDTPLKHYSSGMQLRLAFAVAANLDPEILIVDEVLAVGDAEFQKKCMGKMQDVSKKGRTIIFVSHNLDAVETLCKRSMLFANGKLIDQDTSENLIRKYITTEEAMAFEPVQLSESAILHEFRISDVIVSPGSPLSFSFKIKKTSQQAPDMTDLCLLFYNYKKQRVAIYDLRKFFKEFETGGDGISFESRINSFSLVEGYYDVGLYYGIDSVRKDIYDLARIQVRANNFNIDIKPYDTQYRGFAELI
jgi:lipopolysaccharide transport system ATP-binding protein